MRTPSKAKTGTGRNMSSDFTSESLYFLCKINLSNMRILKKFIICLMMVTLSTSTLLAEKIHVEGYYKNSSFEIGDSWLDSGKRQHFESAKH